MNSFEITLSNGECITIIAESWEKAIETFYKSHTGFSGVLTEIKLVNYGRIIYVQNTGDHETFAEHYGCRETTPLEVFTGKSLPPDGSLALSAKEVEQVNKAISEALKTEPHLNVGPTYEEMEMALLTEQEQNLNLDKEIARLTAILKERDVEIAKLKLIVPEVTPSEVYIEEPNQEAYRIKVDPPTEEDPGEVVDTEHFCKDCRHSNENGSNTVYCCLKELLYEKTACACGSFNSKPRKKKLPEEETK